LKTDVSRSPTQPTRGIFRWIGQEEFHVVGGTAHILTLDIVERIQEAGSGGAQNADNCVTVNCAADDSMPAWISVRSQRL